MPASHFLSACGVLLRGGSVLLVQVNYGLNKGMWMLPGGMVDQGESLEQAAAREFTEETGLHASPGRIVGLRSSVKLSGHTPETSVHVAFDMTYISGTPKAQDENEISGIAFFPVAEALSSPDVVELSKAFLTADLSIQGGLFKYPEPIQTQTPYQSYDVFTCG